MSESLAPSGVSRPVARTSPILSAGRRVGLIPQQGPELRWHSGVRALVNLQET